MKDDINKNQELGKGIEALIRNSSSNKEEATNLFIDINKIIPNKKNPRQKMNKEKLEELKESIYQHGILQPLTVRKIDKNKYELIAGGRRFEAMSQLAQEYDDERFNKVPVFIKNVDSESAMTELALIENLQRSNLNPIEEATAYLDLKNSYSMSDQQIADSIGKSRSNVSNTMRLLNFKNSDAGQVIIEALESGEVTVGQVRPLLDLKPDTQLAIFKKIQTHKLSARQVETEVKKYRNINTPNNEELIKEPSQNNLDDWEQLMGIYRINLSNHLETPVKITKNQNGKGKIVIHYEDEDSLADIIKNKILK